MGEIAHSSLYQMRPSVLVYSKVPARGRRDLPPPQRRGNLSFNVAGATAKDRRSIVHTSRREISAMRTRRVA